MAKQEVFDHKITGPIMRSLRHIPVDRDSGAASFDAACLALKDGELVGVYPEATISRSFEIKEFKSGAARMAIAADVPIVPHIVWGAQRIWTKGHPRKMWRPKVPISVAVGEPIAADPAGHRADRAAALAHAAPARAGAGQLRPLSAGRVLGAPPARRRCADAGRGGRAGGRRGRGESRPSRAAGRAGSAGVAAMEPVFRTLEIAASMAVRAAGTKITYHGLENIPSHGGAVVAINHTSYIDFMPAALGTRQRNRRIRFMIKAEMQEVKIVNFLIKHTGTIPVDRQAGADAYAEAVAPAAGRRAGRGLPGGHHQPRFELKEFKSGAARMAIEAQVPIIPLHRVGRSPAVDQGPSEAARPQQDSDHGPVGTPLPPVGTPPSWTPRCRERMSRHPARGAAGLSASARASTGCRMVSVAVRRRWSEAKKLDEEELAERARRAAERR